MANFNEAELEIAIMALFDEKGYIHVSGTDIHKEISEVLLPDDLKKFLLNNYDVSTNESNMIIKDIEGITRLPLYDANKKFCNMLSNGFIFKREDPNDKDLHINLINYNDPTKNDYKIVNQLELKGSETRIPDGIVYINGLPLVVFEFKSAIKENTTIKDAYDQLTIRYKRDIPDLLKYNAFIVISDGINNKYGSLFAPYEFFYSWRRTNDNEKEENGIRTLYTLLNGLFNQSTLLDVIKDYIYFPDKTDDDLKVVCRYPQYYATEKLFESIKQNMKPNNSGKGGTYFGATGCGKSYTMVFLSRLLMKAVELKSPTVVLITDRTDLDDQLAKQFENSKDFIGDENIIKVESRSDLKTQLGNRESGGVFLTTIHKFTEDVSLLSERNNIICISDEAHRSQVNLEQSVKITDAGVIKKYGFAKYLHDSLPNATYVGFTGTPIDATLDVFGKIVDTYTMKESVEDGITVNIVYEGRATKVLADPEKLEAIEKYYKQCEVEGANEYQVEESKKAVTNLAVIIGDNDRIKRIAKDFIEHYETRVYEKSTVSGKAMFVCMSRNIAYDLYKEIIALRPDWCKELNTDSEEELSAKDRRILKPMPKVNIVMTRDKDDEPELYTMLGTKQERKELDRQFKNPKSNFKIAIVVDMWLTGFDIPCLDTMYIDKPIQAHTLIQTISRVNRVYPGKDMGLVVDYFGIKRTMNDALKMYNSGDERVFEEIDQLVTVFKDHMDVLDRIFMKFDTSKYYNGTPVQKLECLNSASEYAQTTEELEKRFMHHTKQMKSAYNLCFASDRLSQDEKDKLYFYSAVRSIIFKLTKGDAPDIDEMNSKVKQMIQDALISDGVEELFKKDQDMVSRQVNILATDYLEKLDKMKTSNTKIKILQRLLRDAIEEYKRVNKVKGVEFREKLQQLINAYNDRSADEILANDVLEDVAEELTKLCKELEEDKESFKNLGIDFEEKAFFDILATIVLKYEFEYPKEKIIDLAKEIKKIVSDKSKYTDWSKKENIKAELKVDLILLLDKFGYPPVTNDEVYKEVFEQAENFKKYSK